jgi:hypothetical protein
MKIDITKPQTIKKGGMKITIEWDRDEIYQSHYPERFQYLLKKLFVVGKDTNYDFKTIEEVLDTNPFMLKKHKEVLNLEDDFLSYVDEVIRCRVIFYCSHGKSFKKHMKDYWYNGCNLSYSAKDLRDNYSAHEMM